MTQINTPSVEKFLPNKTRDGIALCLSGGGYRAALFHCGAVRRLNELDVLAKVSAFSAVSGGSIFAAFLATRWSQFAGGGFADYEARIAAPFRQFVKNDIRTASALRRLLPWEWGNGAAQSEALQAQYERLLCPGWKLKALPTSPRFYFSAADLAFGVNWIFSRDKVGSYQAGYLDAARSGDIPLAMAVAASSCFPPVFKPMPLHLSPDDLKDGLAPAGAREECIRALSLTDGGVYDNMGLEPVWKNCQTLLVCDGGKPFKFSTAADLPQQLLRMPDIMGNQAEALRKRWIVSSYLTQQFGGAYWGVGNATSDYPKSGASGYSKQIAEELIANIRTDLDRFSDEEAGVLENHGYALADAAMRSYVAPLYKEVRFNPPAASLAAASDDQLRNTLRGSDSIKLLGH